ncbi:mucin-19-like isoform X6 [Cucumis melo var. makuwa]|uniref:Mucin-19-like isoform X6 n=1 Tax=Cucumis melo var. makuwa TaxID=1194695 RepID=A0A5A7VLY3_CUCMM|nr:mucin-19-like isoform X6 [Cucumis melo var. makuwa]TYK22439.1 mucin-19-like isoform X6 [Cucumis melo var. makuwa]
MKAPARTPSIATFFFVQPTAPSSPPVHFRCLFSAVVVCAGCVLSTPAVDHPSVVYARSRSSVNSSTFIFFVPEPSLLYHSLFPRRVNSCQVPVTLGVSEVTLGFWGVTARVVGANSPLFGWIRLDVELNKDFSYSSGAMLLTGIVMSMDYENLTVILPVAVLGFELRRSIVRRFSMDCGLTISFIYWEAYLTGTVSFEITRLICVSFGIMRPICVSFGITRPICASFGITRLICASFEITRLICASFGITRLISASDGITRLIDVRVWRVANRRGARRMREGHMDTSSFFMLPLTYLLISISFENLMESRSFYEFMRCIVTLAVSDDLNLVRKLGSLQS